MHLAYILVSTAIISLSVWLISIIVYTNKNALSKIVHFLLAFSAGSLLGGAFLHLLPEASEFLDPQSLFASLLISFTAFLLVEKIIHWRHGHSEDCHIHPMGYVNFVSSSIHNFIDGLVIAGAFVADIKIGIITAIAIALHEIPHKIGDYGVLIFSGHGHKKAILIDFLSSSLIVVGGVVGYLTLQSIQSILPYLMPVAAGGFIYIATSDLLPEVKKELQRRKSAFLMITFVLGILLMYGIKFLGVS
jgi:zinc and cadmium transporter